MNILLWVLQVSRCALGRIVGRDDGLHVRTVFMFDRISAEVQSFGALPRQAWLALGILVLVCTVWLIVPGA